MTTHDHRVGSLAVTPMALGTMNFGTTTSAADAWRCLDRADEVGARFWDTANNYAFWADGGTGDESETVLGRWFSTRGSAARDRIVLAGKVGARPRPGHRWVAEDPAGVSERLDLLVRHRADVVDRIQRWQASLEVIDQKIADYRRR